MKTFHLIVFILFSVSLASATGKDGTGTDSLSFTSDLMMGSRLNSNLNLADDSYESLILAKREARRPSDLFLGIAAFGGLSLKGAQSYALGGELLLQKDFGALLSGTLSAGYVRNEFESDRTRWAIHNRMDQIDEFFVSGYAAIPIKAGIRIYTGKRFFFGGEVGGSFGLKQSGILRTTDRSGSVERSESRVYNSFLYAVSAGYSFDNGLEAGIKFEDYAKSSKLENLSVRVAYRFKL
ncbi:MAG: hypothetical protein ACO1NU_13340 [Arcticibacter sp.]